MRLLSDKVSERLCHSFSSCSDMTHSLSSCRESAESLIPQPWPNEPELSSKKIGVGVEFPNANFFDLAPFSRRYSGGEGLGMRGLKVLAIRVKACLIGMLQLQRFPRDLAPHPPSPSPRVRGEGELFSSRASQHLPQRPCSPRVRGEGELFSSRASQHLPQRPCSPRVRGEGELFSSRASQHLPQRPCSPRVRGEGELFSLRSSLEMECHFQTQKFFPVCLCSRRFAGPPQSSLPAAGRGRGGMLRRCAPARVPRSWADTRGGA